MTLSSDKEPALILQAKRLIECFFWGGGVSKNNPYSGSSKTLGSGQTYSFTLPVMMMMMMMNCGVEKPFIRLLNEGICRDTWPWLSPPLSPRSPV